MKFGLSAAVVMAVLNSGCGYPVDAAKDTRELPLLLGFPGSYGACSSKPATGVSPEEWERDDFRSRVKSNHVETALNIPCIDEKFSPSELERYANDGDPVALLVVTFDQYNLRDYTICTNIKSIRSRLERAFQFRNDVVPGPESRVPEAAFILAQFEEFCYPGSDEYDRLNLISYNLGYDAAAARGLLTE
ncbi:hypothetical protein D3C72_1534030 [compost metagenome]